MRKSPKITVITVCRNAEIDIEKTIRSVLSQKCRGLEYIVIDGASTDRTLEIVGKYKKRIEVLVSEPDRGIYEAMNKGINLASGEFLFFLNAGDLFFDNLVLKKMYEIATDNNCQLVFGDVALYEEDTREFEIKRQRNCEYLLPYRSICHQSILSHREVFRSIGGYDTNLKFLADRDWEMAFFKAGLKYQYLNEVICFYKRRGVSSDKQNNWRLEIENLYIVTKQLGLKSVFKYFIKRLELVWKKYGTAS